jgi:hypothetical protein
MPNTDHVINESHPDWKAFNGKAAEGVVFTNFAYEQRDEEMQAMADSMPKGYELFLMTDHVQDSKEASFRCAAFVNHLTKEIVFATAGSRFGLHQEGVHDLMDDALLVAQGKPRKMNPAQILNDMTLDSLGEVAKDYNFHYTGHSLGAAMAEMQAADMDIQLTKRGFKRPEDREQITAVTFENPGTKSILEKMYEDAGLPKESVGKLNFCEFQNRGNIINSLNEQAGRTYLIVPNSQTERNPTMIQMIFEVIEKYTSDISPMLGKVFSLLAPGGLDNSLISDHSLANFDEVFVQRAGNVQKNGNIISLEEAYSGIKPIQHDAQIVEKISSIQAVNGNIGKQEFSMNKLSPETGNLDRIVFSKSELNAAINNLKKPESRAVLSNADKVKQKISPKEEIQPSHKLPSAKEIVSPGIVRK